MLGENAQMRECVDAIIAPTNPHGMQCGYVDARRFAIHETQRDQEIVHQPRERKVIVAALDRHRSAVAQHDRASTLDVREHRRVRNRRLARDHVEIEDTLAREHSYFMRLAVLDLARQP